MFTTRVRHSVPSWKIMGIQFFAICGGAKRFWKKSLDRKFIQTPLYKFLPISKSWQNRRCRPPISLPDKNIILFCTPTVGLGFHFNFSSSLPTPLAHFDISWPWFFKSCVRTRIPPVIHCQFNTERYPCAFCLLYYPAGIVHDEIDPPFPLEHHLMPPDQIVPVILLPYPNLATTLLHHYVASLF